MKAVRLEHFALFAPVQAALAAVTAKQIASVTPGKTIGTNIKVVGTMPNHLKALLYLREEAVIAVQKACDASESVSRKKSKEMLEMLAELEQRNKAAYKLDKLFWDALRAEFPSADRDHTSMGYGPNFEVYYGREKDDSLHPGLAVLDLLLRGRM